MLVSVPAEPAAALEHPVTIKMPTAIEQVPALPPHPLDLRWQSGRYRLWIQVDCQALAELLSGRAALDGVEHRPLFIRMARRLLKLYSMGCRPLSDSQDFVLWSPREFNVVADHACNASMDTGRLSWYSGDKPALKSALRAGSNLRVCVDGARRSHTKGALGFAIYCFTSGTYRLLLRGGRLLEQVASPFLAEALALE